MSNSIPKSAVIAIENCDRPFYFVFPSDEDHILKTMRETGSFYELAMLRALHVVLAPGDHVLDVGANVGTHSVYFAGVAGCRVTAFEPVPATSSLLRENCRINGLQALIQVRAEAVGRVVGTAQVVSANATNSGATKLAESTDGELPMVSLDSLLDVLAPVRVIKIDVEGMEPAVISGATSLIARDRPVITCECLNAAEFAALDAQLRELNYVGCNVYNASPTYLFVPVHELIRRPELQALIAASLLAVREDSQSAIRQARAAVRRANEAAGSVDDLRKLQTAELNVRTQERLEALRIEVEGGHARLAARADEGLEALGARTDRNDERLEALRVEVESGRARLATMSDDLLRAARNQSESARQFAELLEALRLEHGLLAKDYRRRMSRAERRFDKMLNGRLFRSLRWVKRGLQRIGLMRAQPTVEAPSSPRAIQAAPSASSDAESVTEQKVVSPPVLESVSRQLAQQVDQEGGKLAGEARLPRPDRVRLAGVAYMSRPLGGVSGHEQTYAGQPLISVIMTAYNTGPLIEPAILSITAQTWANLELIVVDDCSVDDTRAIVERMAAADPRIKLFCFGANRGTYYCKNLGITRSTGVAVTFMDSDDISDPNRLSKQFEALNRPGIAVSTCNHIRVDTEGKTIEINGVTERIAYISQMIKRSVIQEVGFFDSIRTSADDEMLRRIKATYGSESHSNVKRVLYTALLREGSLTRDPENAINFIEPRRENQSFLSPQRRHYAAMVTRWHQFLAQKNLRPYMPFPVVRRPFPVYGRLAVSAGRFESDAVSACLASYPPRREKLREVVARLLPQVDQVHVWLNEYDEVPDFLHHSRVKVELGGKKRNLRDNGKFHFMRSLPSGFVLTVDDDIAYPPDYVQTLIRKVEFYERRAVVGFHGTIFAKPIRNYFRGRTLYHFEHELMHDVVVNQLGTGTVAFHTDLLRPDASEFETTGMADIWFALACKRIEAPMIAIERPAGYLLPLGLEEVTLFREFRKDDSRQTALVRSAEPWGEDIEGDLGSILATREHEFGRAFAQLLPRPSPASTAPVTQA